MAEPRTFNARVEKGAKGRVVIMLPFDPNEAWGAKPRHYTTGTVNDAKIRALVAADEGGRPYIPLGEAWRRECGIQPGDQVRVTVGPEGPQEDNVAEDIAGALAESQAAGTFFSGLPSFYRKNYIRWIESAKRPQTREARILEMIKLLEAGKRER